MLNALSLGGAAREQLGFYGPTWSSALGSPTDGRRTRVRGFIRATQSPFASLYARVAIFLTVGGMRVGSGGVHETGGLISRGSAPLNATSGGHLPRFARPDCAIQPVQTVPTSHAAPRRRTRSGRKKGVRIWPDSRARTVPPNLSESCQVPRPLRSRTVRLPGTPPCRTEPVRTVPSNPSSVTSRRSNRRIS